jgi:hypothetical protein
MKHKDTSAGDGLPVTNHSLNGNKLKQIVQKMVN